MKIPHPTNLGNDHRFINSIGMRPFGKVNILPGWKIVFIPTLVTINFGEIFS